MKLEKLIPTFQGSEEGKKEIRGLATDSRQCGEGSLFFAERGQARDGHAYIESAIHKGATCIVHSAEIPKEPGISYYRVKAEDMPSCVANISRLFFADPSRHMLCYGVTGTNGKTTVSSLIKDILDRLGIPAGYMGTIAVRYDGKEEKAGLTTPKAPALQAYLHHMREAGIREVAIEVSSQGLKEQRTDGVDFDVAIFTNLTWDHLDFHKTMEDYFACKQRLFRHMKKEGIAVLNADDERTFATLQRVSSCPYVSYGRGEKADYRISDIAYREGGTTFHLHVGDKTYSVRTNLEAEYNVYNLTAALAALAESGHSLPAILPLLSDLGRVDGRMERIPNELGIDLIVDYAHTPDGFCKLFSYIDRIKPKAARIYAIFGSAGRRDKGKRAVMGQLAAAHCAKIILTEEDPRGEDPVEIGRMIRGDLPEETAYILADRREAIRRGIDLAQPGDIVLILGKGDEKYMDRKTGPEPWPGDNLVAAELAEEKARQLSCQPEASRPEPVPNR